MMLNLENRGDGTVAMSGRLDAAQSLAAQQFLDGMAGKVTLDCSRLEYISSAGLGVLLKTLKRLTREGGSLRLVGANRHLRDIFQFSGLDKVFEIEGGPG